MSSAKWKKQGGFSKHRNVGSVNINNQIDISTKNLTLKPHQSQPGTTGYNVGSLIYVEHANTLFYMGYTGSPQSKEWFEVQTIAQ